MKNENRGTALILVIVITALMLACCTMILTTAIMEYKIIIGFKQYIRAYTLAEAGAEYGIAEIRKQVREAERKYTQDQANSNEQIEFGPYLNTIPTPKNITLQNIFQPSIKENHKISLQFLENSHDVITLKSVAELQQQERAVSVNIKLPSTPSQNIVIKEFIQYK